MLEYLQKFKNLPPEIKSSISSEAKNKEIEKLEEKYGISLAAFVARIAVKDIYFNNLAANLIKEFKLSSEQALELESELKEKVFNSILGYFKTGPSSSILSDEKGSDEKVAAPAKKIDLSHLYNKEDKGKVSLSEDGQTEKEESKSPKKLDLSHLLNNQNGNKVGGENKEEGDQKLEAKSEREEEESEKREESRGENKEEDENGKKVEVEKKKETEENEDVPSFEKEEKEAGRFSQKAEELKNKDNTGKEVADKIENIIKETGMSFSSQELNDRFKKIMTTYLRGIRNKIDARASLVKEVDKGGLGLDEKTADKALKAADSKKEDKKEDKGKVNIKSKDDGTAFIFEDSAGKEEEKKEKAKIDTRDLDYDLASVLKESGKLKKDDKAEAEADKKTPNKEGKDNKVKTDDIDKEKGKKLDLKGKKKEGQFKKGAVLGEGKEEQEEQEVKSQRKPAASDSKRRMDDIKPVPKSMGPIDELRYMNMETFRRMGQSPSERTGKIKEKVELISKQGIEKRLEAIEAWKQSPINKIYLNIGKQSIGQGKGVEDIINNMKKEGKDVLEKEEFEAVMDLNDELRF